MKTDVKINVHIISAVIQVAHKLCFSALYVLRLIFIDTLIRFKIFFLIILMSMLIFQIEMS